MKTLIYCLYDDRFTRAEHAAQLRDWVYVGKSELSRNEISDPNIAAQRIMQEHASGGSSRHGAIMEAVMRHTKRMKCDWYVADLSLLENAQNPTDQEQELITKLERLGARILNTRRK